MKRSLTIATCCLALLFLAALVIHFRESLFFSAEQKSETASPDGRVVAGVFVTAAGMGEWVTYVTLRRADSRHSPRLGDAIVTLDGVDAPALRWLSENRLLLYFGNGLKRRLMREERRWHEVVVEYQFSTSDGGT